MKLRAFATGMVAVSGLAFAAFATSTPPDAPSRPPTTPATGADGGASARPPAQAEATPPPASPPSPQGQPPLRTMTPRVAFRHALVIKVLDRDRAADEAIAAAEKRDGYFLKRTGESVTLKVPTASVNATLASLTALGVVVSRTTEAKDLGEALGAARTRLQSREGMLERYDEVIADAPAEKVVEVERAMTELVQEIERLRGAITMHQHRLAYAEVAVSFSFPDRRAPVPDGRSSFRWLNQVNLPELLSEFGHD